MTDKYFDPKVCGSSLEKDTIPVPEEVLNLTCQEAFNLGNGNHTITGNPKMAYEACVVERAKCSTKIN